MFAHVGVRSDAVRYETQLKAAFQQLAQGKKSRDTRLAADKLLASDARAAMRQYATAAVVDPKDAENWLGLARALLAIKPEENAAGERFELPVNASAAAFIAYERALIARGQGARAGRARRGAEAPLVVAAGDRRAAGQPRARRECRGAQGATRRCAPSTASA